MAVLHLDRASFDQLVGQNEKPLLVDFWATWCGPCQKLAPELEALAAEHPEIVVGKVDVDQQPELAAKMMVDSIPALFLFRNGGVVKRVVGYMDKETLARQLGL